jgi:hypothetical protein
MTAHSRLLSSGLSRETNTSKIELAAHFSKGAQIGIKSAGGSMVNERLTTAKQRSEILSKASPLLYFSAR